MHLSLELSESEINRYLQLGLEKLIEKHPEFRGKVQATLPENTEVVQLSRDHAKINIRGGSGKVLLDIGLTLEIKPERSGTAVQIKIVDAKTSGHGFLNKIGASLAESSICSRVMDLARKMLADKKGFEVTDDSVIIEVCVLAARSGVEIGGVKAITINAPYLSLEIV